MRGQTSAFFANAANLEAPTPLWPHFHIVSPDLVIGEGVRSVEFEVPLGWLVGRFAMRDVRKIFAFRQQAPTRICGR